MQASKCLFFIRMDVKLLEAFTKSLKGLIFEGQHVNRKQRLLCSVAPKLMRPQCSKCCCLLREFAQSIKVAPGLAEPGQTSITHLRPGSLPHRRSHSNAPRFTFHWFHNVSMRQLIVYLNGQQLCLH